MKAWWHDAGDATRAWRPAETTRRILTVAWIVAAVAWVLIFVVFGDADGQEATSHVLVGMTPDAVFRVDACGAAGPVAGSDALGVVEFWLPAGSCAGGGWVTVAPGAQGVRARCLVRER